MSKHIILNNENPTQKINLKELLKKNKLLVKFYSDTCGYCQDMQSEWDQAVKKINEKNPKKLVILEVESNQLHNFEDDNELKSNLMGYPSIMFIKKNKNKLQTLPFNNERISENFVNFTFKNLKDSILLIPITVFVIMKMIF